MTPRGAATAALLVLAAACSPAQAQERGDTPYQPLFTEEMIGKAAPEQRERMRAAEARNRQTYERRQREKTQAMEVGATPPADSQPPARVRPGRSKVYRWVDDKGRVHFGDSPTGKGAEEIRIK